MNLNLYKIAFIFEGGCYNCPLCDLSSRRCRLTGNLIEWRFKIVNVKPPSQDAEYPDVRASFDPHKHRDVDCPLIAEKVRVKTEEKKKTKKAKTAVKKK